MPFLDLETNWKHPVLNKTVGELLELTPDKSSCTVVSFRQSARDMSFEQFNYVALRVILAQETTLVTKAEDFNAKTVLERFADNFCLNFTKTKSLRFSFRNVF
jgi:hypothetical protein